MQLEQDGMYHFNEEHYTVWYSFEQVWKIFLLFFSSFARCQQVYRCDSIRRDVVQILKESAPMMLCKTCGTTGNTVDFIQMFVDGCCQLPIYNEKASCQNFARCCSGLLQHIESELFSVVYVVRVWGCCAEWLQCSRAVWRHECFFWIFRRYLVQLPFYTTYSFNSDKRYRDLFRNHWLVKLCIEEFLSVSFLGL